MKTSRSALKAMADAIALGAGGVNCDSLGAESEGPQRDLRAGVRTSQVRGSLLHLQNLQV